MNLILRRVVAASALVTLALAWWFPSPSLVRGELVDWAGRYEARYAPPTHLWGAMERGRQFIQSVTAPMPLSWFISQEIEGHVLRPVNPAWGDLFAALERDLGDGRPAVVYAPVADDPFRELDGEHRFVEWRDERGIRHLHYRFLLPPEYGAEPIPTSLRFPSREHWFWLVIGGLGLGLWGFSGKAEGDLIHASSAAVGLRGSAFFAVIFSGLLLWPFVHRTIGSDASFASLLIGFLLLIGAMAALWFYSRQLALVKSLIRDGRFLAHFTYARDEWFRFLHWDHAETVSEKRSMFLFIFGISLVVGLGLMILMRDEASVWVFGGLMGFMAVLGLLVTVLPRLSHRRNLRRPPGQVFIGSRGIYLNGSVHSWNSWGTRFESAEFLNEPLPHVLLVYSQTHVAGKSLQTYRQSHAVRIPIPGGQEETGARVAEQLREANRVR